MNSPIPQLQFQFDPVHRTENNPVSEAFLEQYRDRFTKQCFIALKRMLRGDRITNKDAGHGEETIGHMARRAKDLKDGFGINISKEYLRDENGKEQLLEYFIAEKDRTAVLMQLFNKLKLTIH